jgi:hypothetical protein
MLLVRLKRHLTKRKRQMEVEKKVTLDLLDIKQPALSSTSDKRWPSLPMSRSRFPMAHAILHSEQGPDIAYHLGKNPAEAERISKLAPALQLVELGKIASKLEAPAEAPKGRSGQASRI